MKNETEALRRLFRGILVALAVPVAGCGSTVVSAGADAAVATDVVSPQDVLVPQDVLDRVDIPVQPPVDVLRPPTDVVRPPTDVVSPPTDVVQPPVDVVRPPTDVVSPPTDVVQPPTDGGCEVIPVTGQCNERVTYTCGIPELPDGMDTVAVTADQCARLCAPALPPGEPPFFCNVYRQSPGSRAVVVNCAGCAVGRRTQGFEAVGCEDGDIVGQYFAAAAQLEAASVVAFRTLGAELAAHGAPEDLVREAALASEDERRHARSTRALARARGVEPPSVRIGLHAPRSRAALALENAVEGCVRETFGALVAHYQRTHAADPSVREAMDVIAEDETRHAALAWSVAAWVDATLDAETRAAVRAARESAVDDLARELEADVPEALVRDAGMPPRAVALAMLGGLRAARWAEA